MKNDLYHLTNHIATKIADRFVISNAMTKESSTFASRLAEAMRRAGMSQSELARQIGVKPQSVQYLLSPAKAAAGSRHIAAIARALDVSTDWLAMGDGSMLDRRVQVEGISLSEPGRNATSADRPSLEQCLQVIAEVLLGLEEPARAEIAPLLQALCIAPDSPTLQQRLVRTLQKGN